MFKPGSLFDIFMTRITALESSVGAIDTRHGDIDSLLSRAGNLETDVTGLKTRVTSLETWRNDKAPASENMSTSFNLPTVAVLGLLSTPTKAGIESALSSLASQVNDIKQALRTRGIINA